MVNVLDKYLIELQIKPPNPSVTKLPPDVLKTVLTVVLPFYEGKTKKKGFIKRREVEKTYSVGYLQGISKSAWESLVYDEQPKWSKGNLRTATKKQLIGILNYGNGDHAFYSLKDGKVYIWAHDYGDFTHKVAEKSKKYLWQPMSFKKWVQTLKTGRMIDADYSDKRMKYF
jgi:hypothetical protein